MDNSLALLAAEFFFSDSDESANLLMTEYDNDTCVQKTIAASAATLALDIKATKGKTKSKVPNFVSEVVPLFSIDEFRQRFRLTRGSFEFLLQELYLHGQFVVQEHTKEISNEKQLLVYLDYIGHQCNQSELEVLYDISIGKMNQIVHTISRKIVPALSKEFIKWPTFLEASNCALELLEHHGFPGVIGAIDGCHIEMSIASTDYTTRKYRQAITLQAVALPNLVFSDVFIGCSGRMHDARIFQYSPLSDQVASGEQMYGLHLLGDGAYPLQNGLMTPFIDNGNLTNVQKFYNRRLAAARQIVERAFGQLKARFRRLRYVYQHQPADICYTIAAACTLHNICILKNEDPFDVLLEDIEENEEDHFVQHVINQTAQQKRWSIAESFQ